MVARNRSDYQLLFQICMKDLAFCKNQAMENGSSYPYCISCFIDRL